MPKAKVRICAAPDCDERFVATHGRQKYHEKRCARRVERRNQRAKAKGKKTIHEGRYSQSTARRGQAYEQFCELGGPDLIVRDNWPVQDVAARFGVKHSDVSRWMAAWYEDFEADQAAIHHRPSDEVTEALGDFETFSTTYFKVPSTESGAVGEGEPYIIKPFHRRWISGIEHTMTEGRRLVILSPPRHFKALSDDTPILTRAGWSTIGAVAEGDEVIAADGSWTKVLGTQPQGVKQLYRVTFSDGSSLEACGDHKWSVRQRYGGPWRVKTTDELRDDLRESDDRKKWRIPVVEPIEGISDDLPLDPYLLGCWLGDGTTARGEITTEDAEVVEAFRGGGFPPSYRYDQTTGRAATYGLPGLVTLLRQIGVLGDKHIPEGYLTASLPDRLALLQGLMDTDGSVATNGSYQGFDTTSPELARGFEALVASLGGTWTCHQRQGGYRLNGGDWVEGKWVWMYQLRLPEGYSAFRLARKADKLRPHSPRNTPRRFIDKIEPIGEGSATCLAVDHPDRLFAAGYDFVLTHNTELLIQFCVLQICRNPNIRILWVGPNDDIAHQSLEAVRNELEHNNQLANDVLGPGRTFKPASRSGRPWESSRFTVANRSIQSKSPTMVAIGRGSRLLSRDADLIIVDDVVDGKSVASETQRERDYEWLRTQVSSRKMKHTALVAIGSRQHPDDLWGKLLDNPVWDKIVESAHDEACTEPLSEPDRHSECVLFPELNPFEYLMDQRAELGPELFQMVYLNNPLVEGLVTFTRELVDATKNHNRRIGDLDWRFADGITLRTLPLVAGLDPATSGYQASVLWAVDPASGSRYLVDLDNTKGGGLPAAEQIIRQWWESYGCAVWIIEENNYQGAIMQSREIKDFCARAGVVLKPHFTNQYNKFDSNFGVSTMAIRMRTEPGRVEERPRFNARQIDLPFSDADTQGKVNQLIRQLITWSGENKTQRRTTSDLVMAAWFPEQYIRNLQRTHSSAIQFEYGQSSYPFGSAISSVPWR